MTGSNLEEKIQASLDSVEAALEALGVDRLRPKQAHDLFAVGCGGMESTASLGFKVKSTLWVFNNVTLVAVDTHVFGAHKKRAQIDSVTT